MSKHARKPSTISFWLALASLAGAVGVHIYLFLHHYEQKFGMGESSDSLCNVNERISCAVASASEYSEIFGIPIAVLGAILNGILILLFAAHRWPLLKPETQSKLPNSIRLLSLLILLTSVVMGVISLTVLNSICPFCVAAYILSIFTFIFTIAYFGGSFSMKSFDLAMVPGVLVATLILGFVVHDNNMRGYGGVKIEKFTAEQFLDWQSQRTHEISTTEPIRLHDKSKAKMQIVEFADYLCPHCKTAFPKLHNFVKARKDVSLEFQVFPLDGACNEGLPTRDGARCALSRLAHCGNKQEKGWQAQKWIFDHQKDLLAIASVNEKLGQATSDLQLDEAQLKECMDSEAAHQVIKQQGALGKKLGIQGTPSIFVNGRKVQGVTIPILQKIYKSL